MRSVVAPARLRPPDQMHKVASRVGVLQEDGLEVRLDLGLLQLDAALLEVGHRRIEIRNTDRDVAALVLVGLRDLDRARPDASDEDARLALFDLKSEQVLIPVDELLTGDVAAAIQAHMLNVDERALPARHAHPAGQL